MSAESKNQNVVVESLEARKARNDAFIANFKRCSGAMKQTTIQTKSEKFAGFVLAQGWSQKDMRVWMALCEATKTCELPRDLGEPMRLLSDTIDLAVQLDVHPVGLICYARAELKLFDWNMASLEIVRQKFLVEEQPEEVIDLAADDDLEDQDDDEEETVEEDLNPKALVCPGAPRKRKAAAPLTWDHDEVDDEPESAYPMSNAHLLE